MLGSQAAEVKTPERYSLGVCRGSARIDVRESLRGHPADSLLFWDFFILLSKTDILEKHFLCYSSTLAELT